MKLVFLGTRGEIDASTERHLRHAVLLVVHRGRRVLVDCGADWRGRLAHVRPHAIVLTHAHPDHVGGLADGATVRPYGPSSSGARGSECRARFSATAARR